MCRVCHCHFSSLRRLRWKQLPPRRLYLTVEGIFKQHDGGPCISLFLPSGLCIQRLRTRPFTDIELPRALWARSPAECNWAHHVGDGIP
jgi:hypothetical protein